jgi:hypothetical protein
MIWKPQATYFSSDEALQVPIFLDLLLLYYALLVCSLLLCCWARGIMLPQRSVHINLPMQNNHTLAMFKDADTHVYLWKKLPKEHQSNLLTLEKSRLMNPTSVVTYES